MNQSSLYRSYDVNIPFSGEPSIFPAFLSALIAKLKEKQFYVLLQTKEKDFIYPFEAMDRQARNRNLSSREYGQIKDYENRLERYLKETQACFQIILNSLGSAPYSEMITVIEDDQLSDYQKCKNVIEMLKVRYGGTNAGAVSKVRLAILALKNPETFLEAEELIAGLIFHNRRLGELTGTVTSDGDMRDMLFSKLSSSMFDGTIRQIIHKDNCTFGEAQQYLRAESLMYSLRASNNGRSGSNVSTGGGHVEPVDSSAAFTGIITKVNTVPGGCYNCSNVGHQAKECLTPMCRKCNMLWLSVDDPNYHSFVTCRGPMGDRNQRGERRVRQRVMINGQGQGYSREQAPRSSQQERPTRPGQNNVYRNNVGQDNRRFVPGRVPPVMTSQPSVVQKIHGGFDITDDSDDDVHYDLDNYNLQSYRVNALGTSTEYMEANEDDYWEDAPNHQERLEDMLSSVDHDGIDDESFNIVARVNMMKRKCGVDMDRVPCTQAMLDSGANVTVCSPELAGILHLEVFISDKPLLIEFANGTSTYSSQYVNLGPFLGSAYIVDSVTSVIASCSQANANGFSVWFTNDSVCKIYDAENCIVATAKLRKQDQLYYVDVRDLLNIPMTKVRVPSETTANVNATRNGSIPIRSMGREARLTDDAIKRVM
jgi:hypothetical protein